MLTWLDDLEEWARLIAQILRPGGLFFIREGHPMAMALDYEGPAGELTLAWPYFTTGPIMDDNADDYSSAEKLHHARTFEWAHSLGEILGVLLRQGLTILDFQEFKDLPWKLFDWMESNGHDYVLPEPLRDRCPLSFCVIARR